jgi:hypothetical protein
LQPGDVVVWDNLQPHKHAQVIAAIKAAGGRVEQGERIKLPLDCCGRLDSDK